MNRTLAFKHGLDRLRHPRVAGTRSSRCAEAVAALIDEAASGGGSVRPAEVTNLMLAMAPARSTRGGQRIAFARVFREGQATARSLPRSPLVNVGGGQEAGGDDHASVEAGGGDRVVEEVLDDADTAMTSAFSQGGGSWESSHASCAEALGASRLGSS